MEGSEVWTGGWKVGESDYSSLHTSGGVRLFFFFCLLFLCSNTDACLITTDQYVHSFSYSLLIFVAHAQVCFSGEQEWSVFCERYTDRFARCPEGVEPQLYFHMWITEMKTCSILWFVGDCNIEVRHKKLNRLKKKRNENYNLALGYTSVRVLQCSRVSIIPHVSASIHTWPIFIFLSSATTLYNLINSWRRSITYLCFTQKFCKVCFWVVTEYNLVEGFNISKEHVAPPLHSRCP